MIRIYDTTITADVNVGIALSDDDYPINRAQITMLRGDEIRGIVHINACFYVEEADFTTGIEYQLGFIDEPLIRPNSYIVSPLVEVVTASLFHDAAGNPFAGVQELAKATVTISPNGGIFARVTAVTTPATLAAVDHVIIPVNLSFTKLVPEVLI